MYRVYDDGVIEIVRGDTAKLIITPYFFDVVDNPVAEDLPEYYEFSDGDYVRTHDSTISPDKTYYIYTEYELQKDDTLIFTVKRNTKKKDYIFQKRGREIFIESDDTSGMKYGKYKYDVQWSNAKGEVDTIILPTDFIVREEVTW